MATAKQQARELIEQAGNMIQAGNPQVAVEHLRQSILYNPKDAEAYILLGISLAQVGEPGDATNAFKKAIATDPNNVKGHYNLAVHQFAQGDKEGALASVRAGLEVNPNHANSESLRQQLEGELGPEAAARVGAGKRRPVAPADARAGYEEEEARDGIPFIAQMGPPWKFIGWGLAALSFLGFVLLLGFLLPHFQNGNLDQGALAKMSDAPYFKMVQMLHISSLVGGLAWMIFDLLNRRGNLVWILPQGICGCCGFTWLMLPLYLVFGRNN